MVSLTYGIAVMVVTTALAFGMIWSVEKLARRGIRHDWRMTFRFARLARLMVANGG